MGAAGGSRTARPAVVRRVQIFPGLTAVVLTVLLLWLAGTVAELLLFFFIAILIAIYLDSLAAGIKKHSRLGHKTAFAAAMLVTLVVLTVIGALIVPPLVEQTRQLVAKLPDIAAGWKGTLERLLQEFPVLQVLVTPDKQAQFVAGALDQVQGVVGGMIPRVFNAATVVIDIVSTLAVGLYLALHPATYRDFTVSLVPPRHRDAMRGLLDTLGGTLRSWILAQLLAMVVLGALMTLGLSLLGVPYALTFGIFSGLAAIVPFFGTLVSTLLPAFFVLGGSGGVGSALLVLGLGVVVHLIEGNVVEPLIMSRGVNLPPVFSIMAVLIAGHLIGPLGLLTAVPALCVVLVLVRKILIEGVYGDAPVVSSPAGGAGSAPAPPAPESPESG